MKRKIVWLVVSGLMVLSLLAASCAPTVEEKPAAPAEKPAAPAEVVAPAVEEKPAAPAKDTVKLTLTKLDGTKIEKWVERPRYGGTLRHSLTSAPLGWDPVVVQIHRPHATSLYWDTLNVGDWTRSQTGTGEAGFWPSWYSRIWLVPALAESWEVVDSQTIIYHIRKGVKFHNKPPYGSWSGRELTADDVAFSIKLQYETPTTLLYVDTIPEHRPVSIEATDKYTVVVKSKPGVHIWKLADKHMNEAPIFARDFMEKYKNMNDWRNVIGTGPFFPTDYVPGSSLTYIRNPDYWMSDPLHPENQLPYVDKSEVFIIPDKSTYIAAMRTGKIDRVSLSTYDDLQGILKTRPDLIWKGRPIFAESVIMLKEVTNPASMWSDIRVRKALSMAIDREAIIKDFYRGHGEILNWPVPHLEEYADMYTPLEELPASVQEVFSYNPAKAKQLLAEAGYPKGFKTSIDVPRGTAVDLMLIVKEHWAAIGVDLELKVRDPSIFAGIEQGHTQEHMVWGYTASAQPLSFSGTQAGQRDNRGRINDPIINEFIMKIGELVVDQTAAKKFYKENALPYILETVYQINVPTAHTFLLWQPWLKGYGGEHSVGVRKWNNWPTYVWLDQELKKAMGY